MSSISGLFSRGREYRDIVQQVDTRIAVSGIRGKSSTVRRLHDIFYDRGYDTFAKITGDHPVTLNNGEEQPIERRGAQTTLYENRFLLTKAAEQLAAAGPEEIGVAIFENHAITEYTMRVFNETFLQPQIVVLTNIRTDHTDTLGQTRQDITRSFARSIPEGTHVISGEQHDVIHDYLAEEIRARGASITQVDIPDQYRDYVGVETVYALNHVLDVVGESPVSEDRLLDLLEEMQPAWRRLDDGSRVFNAAKVNEIESTEGFRRQLAGSGDEAELVCPFVFLREDRRGRTASFAEYIDLLANRGYIDRVHVGGANGQVFADHVTPETTVHNTRKTDPEDVLDAVLAEGQPVMTMANTVHPFMREFIAEMQERTVATVPGRTPPTIPR